MNVLIYIFMSLMVLYVLSWFFGIIYLIHPFKFLAWFYHGVLGWHKPDKTQFNDGWGSTITKIGNIINDKWFDMKEFFGKSEQGESNV